MRTLLAGLAVVALAAAGEKNLLENGGVGSPRGWNHTDGAATTTFRIDRKAGKARKGSLYLANTNVDDTTAHNWRTVFDAPKRKPCRLKLTAQVRTKDLGPGARANVMVQLWPEKGDAVGYAWCTQVTADTDWAEVKAVFEVPEACARVDLLAYLVGKGEVWFDDFAVVVTKEELTAPPTPGGGDDRYWGLVRDCGKEIPWLFDADEAKARAARDRKPILAYVRSTDDRDGLASAATTLRAEGVANRDDGLRKDVLFRAGPLSDPDVAALIERRFVPLLLTYHFGSHHARNGRVGWLPQEHGGSARMDPAGYLVATHDGKNKLEAGWIQMLWIRAGQARKVRLAVRVKTRGMERDSVVRVGLDVFGGPERCTLAFDPLTGNREWRKLDETFELPAEFKQVRLHLFVLGKGEAWFDDISVTDRGAEQVFNGAVDPNLGADPLADLDLSAKDVVTPALVVIHDGTARKLHRIGSHSTDLVDRFLRGALAGTGARAKGHAPADLYADGELERVVAKDKGVWRARALARLDRFDEALAALEGRRGPEAAATRAAVFVRQAAWERALAALGEAGNGRDVAWWRAWCEDRLGHDPREAWVELAKVDDRWGRRAAACLLPDGPRLQLSLSERAWPAFRALPEQSEGVEGFDAEQSVRLLMEFQNPDGSFGSHNGAIGFGYWDGTITAYAAEALWRWQDQLPDATKRAAAATHERALAYLRKWTERPYERVDAFNAGYVLSYLVARGEREAGERLMPRIAKGQLPDGNWTVYHPGRPASFNTAISVMALARAKQAGWAVPADVLANGAKALAAMRQASGRFPYSTAPGHDWMSTEHGSIARDSLCEHALQLAGIGDAARFAPALARYMQYGHELRAPTKAYYDYFNQRGHGGYYFFFAHRNALELADLVEPELRAKVAAYVRTQVLAAREGDGAFMDASTNGRAYGTAQALILLAPRK